MTETHEDVKARLRGLVERGRQDYAQKWDFNENPEIAGVVESIDVVTFDDTPTPVATIRDEFSGQRCSVWLSQTVLFNRFKDLAISPGELVYIRYLGEADHAERGKSPVKRFRIEVDRQGTAFNWARFGGSSPSSTAIVPPATNGGSAPPASTPELSEEEHEAAMAAYAAENAPRDSDDIPF